MVTRRDCLKLAAGSIPLIMHAQTVESGVSIGLQSYIFTANVSIPHDRLVDVCIQSMTAAGIFDCDLYAPIVEPADRQNIAGWKSVRKRFNDAGISIHGLSGFPGATVEDFERTADIAHTLGARIVTLGVKMSSARLIAPLARKHHLTIGFQGRPDLKITDPDAIARPDDYVMAAALAPGCVIAIDIGDAVGGGWNILPFVKSHAASIGLIYVKDRRKDNLSVPFGEGDTPLREVLQFIRDGRHPIRCYIDCDYKTTDRPADVKRSFEWVKAALRG